MRSPNWKAEELKLALQLYLSVDFNWLSKMSDHTEEIILLSRLLNSLDLHDTPLPPNFRSPESIRMKLSNFKSQDSRYGKVSLGNIGILDKTIWQNYSFQPSLLNMECYEIISTHANNLTPSLESYIKRFKVKKTDFEELQDLIDDAYSKVKNIIVKLETAEPGEIRNLSKKFSDIASTLNEYAEQLQEPKKSNSYKEHGGINQKPLPNGTQKIGKYVRSTMESLINSSLITHDVLSLFTSREWTKKTFHLSMPFFKKINLEENIDLQLKDANGYVRYWKKIYSINGDSYCICKEWYEERRKYFDNWLNSFNSLNKFGLSSTDLRELLLFIKASDQSNISISRSNLYQYMNDFRNKENILQQFISIGLLAPFQGTERELVVDDYDLLYRMLEEPTNYIL